MSAHAVYDLREQRFGRLVAVSYRAGEWLCHCDCGGQCHASTASLRSGDTRSCGCLRAESAAATLRTHGGSKTLTYRRWRSMRARCLLPNTKSFPRYGGRGITICDEWRDSFENYLRDMGECPGPNWTIERVDNDGPYCPQNCRWATRLEQNRNTSHNRLLDFQGQTLCVSEWAEIRGLSRLTISNRLSRGWTVEQALTTPPGMTPQVRGGE